jgi:hypothetical protein
LGLSPRLIAILEGESLVNDASALIAYKYALIAITAGNFVLYEAGLNFLLVSAGGILIGLGLLSEVLVTSRLFGLLAVWSAEKSRAWNVSFLAVASSARIEPNIANCGRMKSWTISRPPHWGQAFGGCRATTGWASLVKVYSPSLLRIIPPPS